MNQSTIWVTVSQDEYKAYLSIDPDAAGLKLTPERLLEILKENGVISGIKTNLLARIAETHKTRKVAPNILVAEGVRADEGEPPRLDLKFMKPRPNADPLGRRTDYREIGSVITVERDELLAVKKTARPSRDGLTVRGRVIRVTPLSDTPLAAGDNVYTRSEADYTFYYAAVAGAVQYDRHTLAVSTALTIRGDLDFSTGNIRFPGSVAVSGHVKPGFTIEAAGNVTVGKHAEACRIIAGGHVLINEGVTGKGSGEIRAGGHIAASFVENARLEARGNIVVKNGVTGSSLSCDGLAAIENPSARIVGSTISAARGMKLTNAGSPADNKTKLITGLIPANERQYQKLRSTLVQKEKNRAAIEKRYGQEALLMERIHLSSPEIQKDVTSWKLLNSEIQSITNTISGFESQRFHANAFIQVQGALHPGVTIRIGPMETITDQQYRQVTIYYSPQEKKIIFR